MRVFGLFSGIGGFELALGRAGYDCVGLCEIDDAARRVLRAHFPATKLYDDVTRLEKLPPSEILTAGFPCQDLSQAGTKSGITGSQSKLVEHVFRLLDKRQAPEWVILENVSYMLRLNQGHAMQYLLGRLEQLGFRWAYRVMDARSFGLPQRRARVVLIASRQHHPEEILFPTRYIEPNIDDRVGPVDLGSYYGFYWTEGRRGLGWTKDAVPTIKGGSGLGIASPPAIWQPKLGFFGTPDITDVERLFGFKTDWTKPAEDSSVSRGARWKLIGNTICVPMVRWVADQLGNPKGMNATVEKIAIGARPPSAAFGDRRGRYAVEASTWCRDVKAPSLTTFLRKPLKPLSQRAAAGFYGRALESTTLRFADGFLPSLKRYLAAQSR